MALAQMGIGEAAVRHSDPLSLTHSRHVREAASRRVIDRVIVDVKRDDAVRLNALTDEWEKHWQGWKGDTYLVETTEYQFSSGKKVRIKLVECDGKTFTAAASRINRLDWYWAVRSDKGVQRKAKRKVERNRLGRICDRHTVSLSPPQMRLLQKLNLSAREAERLLTSLKEDNMQFLIEETGRYPVFSNSHATSGILHVDHGTSRINPDHALCGEKSLPSLSNEAWTIGAWRQRELGCNLSQKKAKWLEQNLQRFSERHGETRPILLRLHEKLDQDFEQWVKSHGHSKLWEESKTEYRTWVAETDVRKETWAEERASGKQATRLAERIAVQALRVALPPALFAFVMNAMTAGQILADLLELDKDSSAKELLLLTTLAGGIAILKNFTPGRKRKLSERKGDIYERM